MGLIAVLPAAGQGTRMAALTGGEPKELLEVGGKPVLQWVIEECLNAGAEGIAVVGSSSKPQIDGFIARLADPRIAMRYQPEPAGLADAVARGMERGRAALVPMPDYLFPPESGALRHLGVAVTSGFYGAVAVREVSPERVSSYGVVGFDEYERVTALIEKPSPAMAPSRWAVTGRFALSQAAVDDLLDDFEPPGQRRLGNLIELLASGLARGLPIYALRLPESQAGYDCGDPEGYRAATRSFPPNDA